MCPCRYFTSTTRANLFLFLFSRSARDHAAAPVAGREGERDRRVLLPRHRRSRAHHHVEEEREEAEEHGFQVLSI